MSLRVTQIAVGGFDENFSYIIHNLVSKQGCVVDPSGSFQRVVHAVTALGVEVASIVLTHSHHDHVDALHEARDAFPAATLYAHPSAVDRLSIAAEPLEDGQTLVLGTGSIEVLCTPGHTNDSICLFVPAHDEYAPQLLTGDTLFVDGCGRVSSDQIQTLFDSLQRIKALPAETIIFPGHDYGNTPTDTLRNQLSSNRFLNTDDFVVFSERRMETGAVQ